MIADRTRPSIREILARDAAGGCVCVRGWVRTARHAKGVTFLEVSDGSGFAGIQVVADPALDNFEDEIRKLAPSRIVISPGPCTPAEAGVHCAAGTISTTVLDARPRFREDMLSRA